EGVGSIVYSNTTTATFLPVYSVFFFKQKTAYEMRQSFCTRRRLILSMMYSRERGFNPSFFSLSKGISPVVAWIFPLTLLHQAIACPLRSSNELYFIPTMKLSRTNRTVRSTFPFV